MSDHERMETRMKSLQLCIKRLVDLLGSLIGLVVLSPLLLIIAIAIKVTSTGPVFFKQDRLGLKGRTFQILKFRTMVVHAEKMGDGLFVSGNEDSRITAIGKILRKTSLDELPQLINVFMGDMSIVGPRPPVTYHPYKGYEGYPTWAKTRFDMRPGITGLAQVKTRTTVPWDDRIVIDNEYIEHFSLLMDAKILIGTVASVLGKKNIYPDDIEKLRNNKK